ncbi:hypothetical protein CBL_20981, partial [Carabus blaptoides fortunei]
MGGAVSILFDNELLSRTKCRESNEELTRGRALPVTTSAITLETIRIGSFYARFTSSNGRITAKPLWSCLLPMSATLPSRQFATRTRVHNSNETRANKRTNERPENDRRTISFHRPTV